MSWIQAREDVLFSARTWRAVAAAFATALAIAGCDSTEPKVATRLTFDVQPASAVAGATIAPLVRVRVLDGSGDTFTGDVTVTLALTHTNGAPLRGATSVRAVDGVATFGDIHVEKAATGYVLTASSGGLTGATSNPFDVTHAAPAKLRFVDQPTATTAGRPIAPAVTIEATDEFDNRATSATTAVSVGVAGTSAAGVVGTATVNTASGVATFDKIAVNRAGRFSLSATAPGLAPATSAPFDVQLTALSRFCAAEAASAAAFGRMDDAIAATQSGGTVVLCDGAHVMNGVIVDKALAIVAEHDGLSIVSNSTAAALVVNGVASGTVRIAGIVFDVGHTAAVLATGVYDEVVVERSTFRATAAVTAVRAGPRTSLTGRVTVGTSIATGFAEAFVADPLSRLDLADNEIRSSTVNGIRYLGGASGVVQRNRIINCGRDACINAAPGAAGTVEILDNQLTNEGSAQTWFGMLLSGRTVVRRNRIVGPHGDPSFAPAYGQTSHTFKASAIAFENGARDIPVLIEGNEITGAASALQVYNDLSQITARDNRIRRVGVVVSLINDTGAPVFERNDVVEFADAIGLSRPPAGSFRCNWWGRPMGPIGEERPIAPPPQLWHPASSVPIAGQPDVACDVTAKMPPTRFCPAEFSTGRAWPTMLAALSATAEEGTVIVCDGRHPVGVFGRQSVSIVAEHPHAATLVAESSNNTILAISGGVVTVRDLNFELHDGGAVSINGSLVAENNRFTITGNGTAISMSSSSRSVVRNNSITGGTAAVHASGGSGDIQIHDNTIKDQVVEQTFFNASISVSSGGRYIVRNNTIEGCAARCIQSRLARSVIVGNTMRTNVGRGTLAGLELVGGAVEARDNLIEGQGAVADRSDGSGYAFTTAGIVTSEFPTSTLDDSVALIGNSIANARSGIWIGVRRMSGRDNAVSYVRWALELTGFLDGTIERSDFTEYVDAFLLHNGAPYEFAACNYWGNAAGPTTAEDARYYTPFSTEPIAKKSGVQCP